MKKIIFSAALISALCISCTKETFLTEEANSNSSASNGRTVTLTAKFDNSDDESKLTIGEKVSSKVPIYWNNGDKFVLYTIIPEKDYDYTKLITTNFSTYCGEFTATGVGEQSDSASFIGVIPSDAVCSDHGLAFFPAEYINTAYKKNDILYTSSKAQKSPTTSKDSVLCTGVTFTIATTQDGSGNKYMLAGARFDKGKLSNFKNFTQLFKMTLSESDSISRIEIENKSNTNKTGLCGDDWKVYWNPLTSSFIQAGATTKQLTIENGGVLKGTVYAVTRTLTKPDTLYLKFHYRSGLTKQFRKAITSSTNLGYVYDLGSFNLTQKTIVYNSKSPLPVCDTASLSFPYYNSSDSLYYGTDGKTYAGTSTLAKSMPANIDWTIDNAKFTFVTSSNGYYITSPGGRTIQLGKGGVVFPSMEGYKLTKINLSAGNSETRQKSVSIYEAGTTDVVAGGEAQSVYKGHDVTWDLTGTVGNKRYAIVCDRLQIVSLTLTYTML